MALVQNIEMNRVVGRIVRKIRKKAEELDIRDGVIVIYYNNDESYSDLGNNKCFDDLLSGEDRMRVFSIGSDSHALSNGENRQVPEKFYSQFSCSSYISYPLLVNDKPCGDIYVAVSGGTDAQNELCAWEAYEPIVEGLAVCKTSNSGPNNNDK